MELARLGLERSSSSIFLQKDMARREPAVSNALVAAVAHAVLAAGGSLGRERRKCSTEALDRPFLTQLACFCFACHVNPISNGT